MVPGGQVPPCIEWRRIYSQSEMADNSLTERSDEATGEGQSERRIRVVFSLRRGDV